MTAKIRGLRKVFVTCLGSLTAVLSEDVGIDIELHGAELDNACRCKLEIGKAGAQDSHNSSKPPASDGLGRRGQRV
jgi:hypothetical protein